MLIARGAIVMHVFVTFALIIGPALLLTIGFLSVVRDLLSRSVFAPPSSPNEDLMESAEGESPAGVLTGRARLRPATRACSSRAEPAQFGRRLESGIKLPDR
jgi:hypothetical protein